MIKFNLSLLLLSLSILFIATGCDNDDDRRYQPETVVQVTFRNMYPDAAQVEWEPKLGYSVAEFYDNKKEKDAWFNTDGEWLLTETDLVYADLPDEVVNAIAISEYTSWKKEDVDYLERKDMEPVYTIEVEQGNQELDLYYSVKGVLLKVVTDGSNDHIAVPTPVNEEILKVAKELYPNAKIVEIDIEQDWIEVDLQEDYVPFTMILSKKYQWIRSEWEIAWTVVPEVVKAAIKTAGYTINVYEDDADKVTRSTTGTGQETVYRIELDREPNDIVLYFTEAGQPTT